MTGSVTTIETWCIEHPPRRLSATTVLPGLGKYVYLSPAGKYVHVSCIDGSDQGTFYCDGEGSPKRVVAHVPPGRCQSMKFSEDDKFIACVTSEEAHGRVTYTVHLLEAEAGVHFRHIASYELYRSEEAEVRSIGIAVSDQHVPVIVASHYYDDKSALLVLELLDRVLKVTTSPNHLILPDAVISSDGNNIQCDWQFINTKWPQLYPLPHHGCREHEKKEKLHPIELDINAMYIEGSNLYRLRQHTTSGLIFLMDGQKPGAEVISRRRVVGVLPDRCLDNYDTLKLVWPPADAEDSEVKLLVLTMDCDRMAMIRTGIDSASLLVGEEWEVFDTSSPFQSMTGY